MAFSALIVRVELVFNWSHLPLIYVHRQALSAARSTLVFAIPECWVDIDIARRCPVFDCTRAYLELLWICSDAAQQAAV